MASRAKIQAEPRTEFGKGAARRIRRADKVPAVLYGHGTDPVHITLPGHDTMLALKHGGANALLYDRARRQEPARAAQAGPARPDQGLPRAPRPDRRPQAARRSPSTSRCTWSARPPRTRWSSPRHSTVPVEAEATHIPESSRSPSRALEAGTQILAKDLSCRPARPLLLDDDALVVNVTARADRRGGRGRARRGRGRGRLERDEPEERGRRGRRGRGEPPRATRPTDE